MGDTHHDPVDHHRTALPHAGATFKDALLVPGLLLLALSVVAVAVALASAGYMQAPLAAVIAAGAVLTGGFGVAAIFWERRRVRRRENSHSARQ